MRPEQAQVLSIMSSVVVVCLVAWMMVQAGVAKNLLQWKRGRHCPSCGRQDRDCSCRQRAG